MSEPIEVDIDKIKFPNDRRTSFTAGVIVSKDESPLVVDKDFNLIEGWMRFQSFKAKGMKKVPVIIQDPWAE